MTFGETEKVPWKILDYGNFREEKSLNPLQET